MWCVLFKGAQDFIEEEQHKQQFYLKKKTNNKNAKRVYKDFLCNFCYI